MPTVYTFFLIIHLFPIRQQKKKEKEIRPTSILLYVFCIVVLPSLFSINTILLHRVRSFVSYVHSITLFLLFFHFSLQCGALRLYESIGSCKFTIESTKRFFLLI